MVQAIGGTKRKGTVTNQQYLSSNPTDLDHTDGNPLLSPSLKGNGTAHYELRACETLIVYKAVGGNQLKALT